MRAQEVLTLFEYHCSTNTRLLEKYARLENQFTGDAGSLTPLRATLAHILDADTAWRGIYQTGDDPPELTPDDFPDAGSLDRGFKQEEEEWRSFLGKLDDSHLDQDMDWTNPLDERTSRPLWQVLFHVFNHGTQHRSEVAAGLTEHGASPGDLDFLFFLWERDHA
jgi:uncharacterized damage-inducible protein DinB